MKMHRWIQEDGTYSRCEKCGIIKKTIRQDRFVRTEYIDVATGECWLRAPECDSRLVMPDVPAIDNQLKLDL